MPREPQGGHHDPRRSVEWRDPRRAPDRARDHDVRMDDRRDRELFHDLPSVTNRSFGPIDAGDGFGYAGQGGWGQDLRMGGYSGVGPKDAARSDDRIQDELHVRLTDADSIDATAVIPVVTDGKVTLNGWVPERWMKHDAEELAHHIRGVKDVDNRIRVGGDPRELGRPGEAIRSGNDQKGSGFSSPP
ncbi:BON domain-containing protein [Lysobacter sp. A6]|uniref:BON domain-containing protein n=1 Tax=Noviluteimonas lactosilytica TaxID=2888523 RepID=A0ABS8JHZ2_9GAMM|nr:BON domain-containing protein [Lysobacter lactosilyticus]MCC8363187.1 BON domain-containing protein [Lysobacter lactosilyticus]